MSPEPGAVPYRHGCSNTFFSANTQRFREVGGLWALIVSFCLLASCGNTNRTSSMALSYRDITHTFASTLVKNSVDETVLTLTNTGTASFAVGTPTLTGSSSFTLVPESSCAAELAAGSSCPIVVRFTPAETEELTATLIVSDPDGDADDRVTLTGQGRALAPGTVSTTTNPLVANYTIAPGVDANVSIDFGPTTSYGLQTWTQPTSNGSVSILVAGMRQNTQYHMRAVVHLSNGNIVDDADHIFTTSAFAAASAILPQLTVTSDSGITPQPGVELVSGSPHTGSNYLEAFAVDLQGNIVWGYTFTGQDNTIVNPVKLLDNGHLILVISVQPSNAAIPPAPGTLITLREIDLAGTTIRELTLADLNAKLASSGQNLTLTNFHHDVTPLPNGHFLLMAATLRQLDNVTGFPGTVPVLGDVVVDLDKNFNPVWIWNEFDHLDVNRHPINFPADWTHSNAIVYSKDDGNILVSSRHQSWIMKVDYEDGAGSGNIIWRLGQGGDFTLVNGTDPTDWFYGQHQPSFVSPNTTGVFSLAVMDNGYGRLFPAEVTCGSPGSPQCNYTRAPIFRIDENAKTATLIYPNQQPAAEYSFFGGGTTSLANGNLEFDLCSEPFPGSIVREITQTANPTVVWELDIAGENAYRANRIPSLYPGIQW